jgi:serine/threonine protein kinase
MSRQTWLSSSSSSSSSSGPLFASGLMQSQARIPQESKRPLSPPGSSVSPMVSGARRWEILYGELKLDKKLGKGAYGEVWAGTYRKSRVAIKVYDFQGELSEEQKKSVLNEADLMEGLRSEYLVNFRGICLKPRYCLVMELCEGGTLRARLDKTSEKIAPREQLRWAMQASYGLHQLHSVRIVHRDLKGENILLDKSSDAKVADFGLSVVKSTSASQSKKGEGAGSAGTLPWMAPELFDRKPNSSATDVYSLGIVLWEILTRKIPFAEVMPTVIVGMALSGKREELPEKCPEVFRLMITACWDANPKKRPTAEQVGNQFDVVLKSVESIPAKVSGDAKVLKPEKPASLPPAPQPGIKKPVTSELVSPPPSVLSQSRFTIAPAPKPLLKPVDAKVLDQLLRFVAEGEQDKAEGLIQKDKNLLLHVGTVKDLSGREFKQITAFQYALWAMDYHMWTMIQKYLPKESQAEQLQTLESKGTAHGNHFSLKELTDALQVYANAEKVWQYDQRATDHWCKVVGGAQTRLPAHVVNEYCREDRPFEPCPQEWESKLPRTREVPLIWNSMQLNYTKGSWFIPFNAKNGLGLTYAFSRYNWEFDRGPMGATMSVGCGEADLKALQSLWKTRTQQLELLASQLKMSSYRPGVG